jgi:ankyrin repeat protein
LNPNWRWEDEEQGLLIACSSLIAVVEAGDSRVVQFSHFSVKEYLTSTRLAASDYHIDLAPANTTLAEACVGVLLHLRNVWPPEYHPLARYAARHWTTHTQIGGVSSRLQKAMEYLFGPENPPFREWCRLYDIDTKPPGLARLGHFFHRITEYPRATAPLYYASLCGFQDLVQHLIIKYPQDVNASGGRYATPLVAALAGKHFQTADLLRRNGAALHFRGDHMRTPLHFAASNGDLEVVQKIIEYDIRAKNTGWHRFLHFASSKVKGGSVLRLLPKSGAHINARDMDGSSPLHYASFKGDLEIVCQLLEHGADVKARTTDGSTPLHEASACGALKVVRLLLERGADIKARAKDGSTPLHNASSPRYGLPWRKEPMMVVALLLEHGADVNAREQDGVTPLHKTSFDDNESKVVRLLLERGADVKARAKDGSTPLHEASLGKALEAATLLLQHGADVNARAKDGSTPLHRSSKSSSKRNAPEVVRLLLRHGADVKTVDNRGMTALQIAGKDRTPWVPSYMEIRRQDEVIKLLEHEAK